VSILKPFSISSSVVLISIATVLHTSFLLRPNGRLILGPEFVLEQARGGHLVLLLLYPKHGQLQGHNRTLSTLVLKACEDRHRTTPLDNLFQHSTVLVAEKVSTISGLNLLFQLTFVVRHATTTYQSEEPSSVFFITSSEVLEGYYRSRQSLLWAEQAQFPQSMFLTLYQGTSIPRGL